MYALQELGLRSQLHIAQYLPLDNAIRSHLLADVSNVNYARDAPPCALEPVSSDFADDVYVYAYVPEKYVYKSRGASC